MMTTKRGSFGESLLVVSVVVWFRLVGTCGVSRKDLYKDFSEQVGKKTSKKRMLYSNISAIYIFLLLNDCFLASCHSFEAFSWIVLAAGCWLDSFPSTEINQSRESYSTTLH